MTESTTQKDTKTNKWWIIGGLIFILLAGIVVWNNWDAWFAGDEPVADEDEDTKVAVEVTEVFMGDLKDTTRVSGQASARASVDLTPKMGGEVEEVHVNMGEEVSAGDPLVKFDDADIRPQVLQAEAAIEAAQAQLDQIEDAPRQQEIDQARSSRDAAKSAMETAEWTYERMERLYEQDVISGAELKEAEMEYESARSQLKSAEAALDMAVEGAQDEEIRMAQAQLKEAEGAMTSVRNALEDTVLESPIDGTVAYVEVDPGDLVDTGMPTVGVVDIDPIRVDALVTDKVVGLIDEGDEVAVKVSAIDETFDATVSEVAPSTEPETGMYPVRLLIDNANEKLKPGMTAELIFVRDRVEDVPIVPRNALISRADEYYVFVVENGIAQRRPVRIGLTDEEYAVVESGLSEGELIVDYGVQYLEDGVRVEIVEER